MKREVEELFGVEKQASVEADKQSGEKEEIEENKNEINPEEGKLYLANIPLNFSQQKIRQEFEKYGKVLELKLRKKTEKSRSDINPGKS